MEAARFSSSSPEESERPGKPRWLPADGVRGDSGAASARSSSESLVRSQEKYAAGPQHAHGRANAREYACNERITHSPLCPLSLTIAEWFLSACSYASMSGEVVLLVPAAAALLRTIIAPAANHRTPANPRIMAGKREGAPRWSVR